MLSAMGWETREETEGGIRIAGLKDDYVVGNLGFDPLNLTPKDKDEFVMIRNKELSNGRLATIGVAGIVAQELVNGKSIWGYWRGKNTAF